MLDQKLPSKQALDDVTFCAVIGLGEGRLADKVHEQVRVPPIAWIDVKLFVINVDIGPITFWELASNPDGAEVAEVLEHARFHARDSFETSHRSAMLTLDVMEQLLPSREETRMDCLKEFAAHHRICCHVVVIPQDWQFRHEYSDNADVFLSMFHNTKL